jgi:hypothetical protein
MTGVGLGGPLAQAAELEALPKETTHIKGTTGFYRVAQVGDKWTFLTTNNKPLYLRGLSHYGDGTYMPLNREEKYGTVEVWRKSVRDRHAQWGFNYLPPSIGPSEPTDEVKPPIHNKFGGTQWQVDIRRTLEWPAEHFAALDYPFTAFLEVPRQYMAGLNLPDVSIPVTCSVNLFGCGLARRAASGHFNIRLAGIETMEYDADKVDEAVLALLMLTVHEESEFGARAWKGHDWDALNRLHEKGFIGDPVSKAKSVVVTPEGLAKGHELFARLFS